MKRTLLLAALAATAATSAFAQSSVTIYGRLNMTLEREKFSGQDSANNLNNNSSRIGFRGTEDLGGGLKALFELEHGFNPDTGTASQGGNNFWARSSFVGLEGGFGKVRLGNMTSAAYYATADYVSMHNHDTGTSSDALYDSFSQPTDKVSYTTPSFGGNTIEVAMTTRDNNVGARTADVAYNGDFGPLHVGAGFTKAKDGPSEIALRALYELGAFTFGGYYQRTSGEFQGTPSDSAERNNFRFAAMYALGAGEFHANVGWAGDRGGVDNTGAKQYTLGYNHNLSKRTKLYGYYTTVRNDSGAAYMGAPTAGSDYSSLAAGIRHNF
jgi:predicted porin